MLSRRLMSPRKSPRQRVGVELGPVSQQSSQLTTMIQNGVIPQTPINGLRSPRKSQSGMHQQQTRNMARLRDRLSTRIINILLAKIRARRKALPESPPSTPVQSDNESVNSREEQKPPSTAWRLAGVILGPGKLPVVLAGVALVACAAFELAAPAAMGRSIDAIAAASSATGSSLLASSNLQKGVMMLFGCYVGSALCQWVYIAGLNWWGETVVYNLRRGLLASLLRRPQNFFDTHSVGGLSSRISSDTVSVKRALTGNISTALYSVVHLTGGVVLMSQLSPKLCAVVLTVFPAMGFISYFYGKYVQRVSKQVSDELAEATGVAEDVLRNMRSVRVFGREQAEHSRYSHRVKVVLDLGQKMALVEGAAEAMSALAGSATVIAVMYVGGHLVLQGAITLGSLSAFLVYAVDVGNSVGHLATAIGNLNSAVGSGDRIFTLMEKGSELGIKHPDTFFKIPVPKKLPLQTIHNPQGVLEFRDVSFQYPTRSKFDDDEGASSPAEVEERKEKSLLFNKISFTVKPGEIIAFVGASGSGKSTIASLITRLYEPVGGSILLDGVEYRNLDYDWLRQVIGYLPQETSLLGASVAENIAYRQKGSYTMEDVEAAARMAKAHSFIMKLPHGYDTVIGATRAKVSKQDEMEKDKNGVLLSGGQRQRVALARAVYGRPPALLVLDEPTSALDHHSESVVCQAVKHTAKQSRVSTIIITHRPAMLAIVDRVLVLDAGRIYEAKPSVNKTEKPFFKIEL